MHDPISVFSAQPLTVGPGCIGFARQHSLSAGPFYHMPQFRALGAVGGRGVNFVDEAFLIGAGKCLIAQCGFGSFLHPAGIRSGAELHIWIVGGLALPGPVVPRYGYGAEPRGVYDCRFGFLQLQPVRLNLAT